MESDAAKNARRAEHARALAALALCNEPEPQRWQGYFERLLSGATIGPLSFGAGHPLARGHAVCGQYGFRLDAGPEEAPDPRSPALRAFRDRLQRLRERDVAIGVDLSALPPERFNAWLKALSGDIHKHSEALPVVFSLRAEHPACHALLQAAQSFPGTGMRAALRVNAATFQDELRWKELVRASHANPRIELVLAGEQKPLTDLMGSEKPNAIMPLSLFEAPAGSAWLGMQFDLSTIPPEQIGRGVSHLRKLVRVGARLADNLIDSVPWPSPELQADAVANRRLAAHVTGIGDLVMRHGLDPARFSTLRLLQRWLALFKRQLLRESLRLARERGPYPALNAQQLVAALSPRYGEERARRIIARRSPRHRQLLALSPYCIFPSRPTRIPAEAWLNLLPLIAIADNATMYGSQVRSLVSPDAYERMLRSTWALLRDGPGG